MRKILTAIVTGLIAIALTFVIVSPVTANDKVYICHAAGRDGTLKYKTLHISKHALNAHFENNGTPKAGHEHDYMGKCVVTQPTPTPTPTPEPRGTPTPTPEPEPTPTPIPSESLVPDPTETPTVTLPPTDTE